jgi:hypothetical protein
MKLGRWLIGLSLAGVLLGNPVKGLANDDSANTWQFVIPDEPTIEASTDYCYGGTLVDPTTGEAVDFYNLCTDDLDLA